MGGITLAWLIGEGIIITRSVTKLGRPPMPGELLGSAAFFALLAILAEYQPARGAATLLAFGVDIAAWLQAPGITPAAQKSPGPSANAPAPAKKPGAGGAVIA